MSDEEIELLNCVDEIEQSVEHYCDDVLSGKINAGKLIKLAVRRYRKDRKDKRWTFDRIRAARPVLFIQELKHPTGEFADKNFILNPWQRWVLWNIFGFLKPSGYRRFNWAMLQIGRGNGKTPLSAAIELYLCCADDPPEPGAEVINAATTKGQAKLATQAVENFIKKNDVLKPLFEITKDAIVYRETNASIFPLARNPESKDGFVLHGFVCDELHAWKKEHKELLDKVETAMGKRRQPLGIYITTAGSDKSQIWIDKYNHASNVLQGIYDDESFFAAVYETDDGDDHLVEKNWIKANPNLGVSVQVDYLKGLAAKAKRNPDDKNNFVRYHANRLVRSKLKAINLTAWDQCPAKLPDLTGKRCYGGLDLGWRNDLASFSLTFPQCDNYIVKTWSWIPEVHDKRNIDDDPWFTWIKRGELIVTPGDITDVQAIYHHIKWCLRTYSVQTIALDPNNAREMSIKLINELGMMNRVFDFFQSTRKYNEPVKKFLDLIDERKFNHGGNRLLKFAANNLILKKDTSGCVMPDKENSTDKIDPIVATIMSLSEALYAEAKSSGGQPQYYRSLNGNGNS